MKDTKKISLTTNKKSIEMKDTREKMYKAPWRPFSGKGVAALALAAVLTAGAASCKKDNDATPSSPTGALGFRATVEAHTGDGKTYLYDKQVKWNGGEKVAVYNGNGDYGTFEARDVSTDGKSANLWDLSEEFGFVGPYRAVYPRPETPGSAYSNGSVGEVPLNANGVQTYAKDGFPMDGNPMAAYAESGASGTTTLSFKNLCGLLKVTVSGNAKVKTITITSNDPSDVLWGKCKVSMAENGCSITEVANTDANKHTITMDCSGVTFSTGQPTSLYFVLPPGVLDKGFTMEAIDGNNLARFRKKASVGTKIEANKITDMADITMNEDNNLAGTNNDKKANCYIVPQAGNHMFPCNKKGNGIAPATGSACLDYLSEEQKLPDLSGYKTASVVWETVNTATAPATGTIVSNVRLEGDYVHFTTGDTPGNALIAVKDVNGDILWSWHIWRVNDYDATNSYYEAFGLGYNHKLMDRNLGALSKTPGDARTAGFLYQWGRKDPLFGSANYKESSKLFMNGVENKTFQAIDNASSNVANTIKQPDAFAKCTNTGDWFSNTGGLSDGLWGEGKTMYDPCPYGWKVPKISETTGSEQPMTTNTWGTYNGTVNDNWEDFDTENRGRKFIDGNNNESFYPTPSCRTSAEGNLESPGNVGCYWSCSYTNNSSYSLYFYNTLVTTSNVNSRTLGFSVRPVKYDETSE